MGVEYRHFIVVNDAKWFPQPDTLSQVERVLRDWSLVDKIKKAVDLSGGRVRAIPHERRNTDPGHGLAVVFYGVEGAPVPRIAGPSHYDQIADAERYIQKCSVVVGTDFRIQPSSELLFVEVTHPPQNGLEPVTAHSERSRFDRCFDSSFPADRRTAPPKLDVVVEDKARAHVASTNWPGWWRGALVIEFGKDLPAFVEGMHTLPNREFVRAVSEAFRGAVVEVGEIY